MDAPGLRSQARLLEAAFDNELEQVQQTVSEWVEECFSPLIGAKLDCTDANEHTPLSEAACGGALEVRSPCFGLRLGFGFGFGLGLRVRVSCTRCDTSRSSRPARCAARLSSA